jgi:hypothetical protein
MPFASHILAAGNSPLTARTSVGSGAVALVAVGTNQATALQLSASWNTITTSSASTGVKLLPCEEGALMGICNNSGQTITVYTNEATGVTMNNAVAGSTGVTLATGKQMIIFAPSYNTWATVTTA